jgi:hypothetical protein
VTLLHHSQRSPTGSLFGWLVADGWCWFALREEYCWLIAGGWFVLREKYCWLVADKPNEQGAGCHGRRTTSLAYYFTGGVADVIRRHSIER